MSNQTINKTRRTFLKGAAYTTALSIGGISSTAIIQNKNKETVSLLNHSDIAITLDASYPVTIERIKGKLVAKPNIVEANSINGMLLMKPHQSISFEVETKNEYSNGSEIADFSKLYQQNLEMTSVYPTLNKLVSVSTKAIV